MTIYEMRERKKELGYSIRQLSELSGVPFGTVMKVFGGSTSSPRHSTITALERVLGGAASDPGSAARISSVYQAEQEQPLLVREPVPVYGSAAERLHTVEDYLALPKERRAELIDGIFYDMAAPTLLHQDIAGRVYLQLLQCADRHPGNCRVYISPVDVQLNRDRYTMVQPDIIAVCDPEKVADPKKCFGAPDLTVEILSPSTRGIDSILKLHKYRGAGVREFWLVDPESKKVTVYLLENGSVRSYTFQERVPLYISGGDCEVDFSQIAAAVF